MSKTKHSLGILLPVILLINACSGSSSGETSATPSVPSTPPIVNAAETAAASCSAAAIQQAVVSAQKENKPVVVIPAGYCNWGAGDQVDMPSAISLRGAGKDKTTISRAGASQSSNNIARALFFVDCGDNKNTSISGLTLVGNGVPDVLDNGLILDNTCVDFKVFANKFTRFSAAAISIESSGRDGIQRGVIYQNDFIDNYVPGSSGGQTFGRGYGVVVYGNGIWSSLELGTQNAVFIEDNYMTGNRHHVASNNASRYVFRNNTVIANQTSMNFAMVDAHGLSSSPAGSRSWEIYQNKFSADLPGGNSAQAAIGIRGGDGVVFNNTVAPNISWAIYLEAEGAPYCGAQNFSGQTTDAWFWNNASSAIDNSCPASIKYASSAKPGYTPYAYPHPLR